MGEDTLEDNFTESFGKEEGGRTRSPAMNCEGERERERESFGWRNNRMRKKKKKGVTRPNWYSK
jgi:hypothetical protein